MTVEIIIEVPAGQPGEVRLAVDGREQFLAPGDKSFVAVYPGLAGYAVHVSEAPVGSAAAWKAKIKADMAARDAEDFPLGKACDLSGDTGCEACQ